jgi:hypothetical protein
MAKMQDSEEEKIPCEENGNQYFDIYMIDWSKGLAPDLQMNVPCYFEGGDGSTYDSCGIVYVSLQDVLEQYLNEFQSEDGGENLHKFIPFLRDYADRLEAKAKELGVL